MPKLQSPALSSLHQIQLIKTHISNETFIFLCIKTHLFAVAIPVSESSTTKHNPAPLNIVAFVNSQLWTEIN